MVNSIPAIYTVTHKYKYSQRDASGKPDGCIAYIVNTSRIAARISLNRCMYEHNQLLHLINLNIIQNIINPCDVCGGDGGGTVDTNNYIIIIQRVRLSALLATE